LEGIRKANEGADHELWKDVIELKKDETKDAYFVGKVCNLILWFCPDFWYSFFRVKPRLNLGPRRRRKSTSRSTQPSLDLNVADAGDGVAEVAVAATEVTEAVVVEALDAVHPEAVRMDPTIPPSAWMTRPLSPPCLKMTAGLDSKMTPLTPFCSQSLATGLQTPSIDVTAYINF
jgi:hypothetical protein